MPILFVAVCTPLHLMAEPACDKEQSLQQHDKLCHKLLTIWPVCR